MTAQDPDIDHTAAADTTATVTRGPLDVLGALLGWLTVAMVIITCAVVLLRYGFDTGAIVLQELVIYFHGTVFLLGLSYTLKHDGHVRVDVIYGRSSPTYRRWVNLIGHLLLLFPVSCVLAYTSYDYALKSWQIMEKSAEVGGIPAVFLLKSLIPFSAALLALQAIVESWRLVNELRDHTDAR